MTPQPGTAGTDDDPLDSIETKELVVNGEVIDTLVGLAFDSANASDGVLRFDGSGSTNGITDGSAKVIVNGTVHDVAGGEWVDFSGTSHSLDSWEKVVNSQFDGTVTGTTSPVAPGNTLDVTVDVTNNGTDSDTQTVTLDIDNGVGQVDSQSVSLSGGGSTTKTLSWSVPSGQTEQDYQATVSSADDSASQTVTVGLGIQVVDNFEDSPTGPYSSGDSISTYYSGDTGSFTRSTATSATGSFSLERTSSGIISSQPGDGLPYYPQIGDRFEFYARDGFGASPRVRFGMDGNGSGYQIYVRADNNGRRRFWVERVDSGTRVQIAQASGLSFGRLAWVRIEVDWHDGSGSESNGTIVSRLYDSNDNLVHTHNVTDTTYLNDRGVGFSTGGNAARIVDGYRRLGGV